MNDFETGSENAVAELLSAYDAGLPRAQFRRELHQRLRDELRQTGSAALKPKTRTRRRSWSRGWAGVVAGVLLLATCMAALRWSLFTSTVAEAPPPGPSTESAFGSGQTIHATDQTGAREAPPASVQPPETVLATHGDSQPAQAVDEVAIAPDAPEIDAPLDHIPPAPQPVELAAHDASVPPVDQRQWAQAWGVFTQQTFMSPTDRRSELLARLDQYYAAPVDAPTYEVDQFQTLEMHVTNNELAYRVQTAVGARKQLDPLVASLLAEKNESKFIAALSTMPPEDVNLLAAQLTGDMATAAKVYLELLLRSREAEGIQRLDKQLHGALASEQLADPQQELVRLWLRQLDEEKQRRKMTSVMM